MNEQAQSTPRRSSFLAKMHLGKGKKKEPESDTASTMSKATTVVPPTAQWDSKPRRSIVDRLRGGPTTEGISDSGPFKIIVDENGKSRCVENNDWPPGTHYEIPDRINKHQGMGEFYAGKTVMAGGEGANIGPDPDWIPGLSEEERAKLKKDRSGQYTI